MRKLNFKKMFAAAVFFIVIAVVSIMNVSQAKAASITVTSPNGEEIWKVGETHRITWMSVGVEKVVIYLYDDRISSSGAIVNYPVPDNQPISASQGYYDWTILANVLQANDGINFTIVVQDASNYQISGKSSAPFSIVAMDTPSVTVLSPNGGESWTTTGAYSVKWTSQNISANTSITVEFLNNSGVVKAYSTTNNGNLNIEALNLPIGSDYKVRVYSYDTQDFSNATFSIVATSAPSITVTSPNGGETWKVGETKRIAWQASNFLSTDKVKIYVDITDATLSGSGVSNYVTDQEITASQGYYDWNIAQSQLPNNSTRPHQYKIRISESVDPYTTYDTSDAPFNITANITVTSPNGGEQWHPGETHLISWKASGVNHVKLYIYDSNISGTASVNYITKENSPLPASQEYYKWTVPELSILPGDSGSKNYRIKIEDADNSSLNDISNAPFSIVAADQSIISSVSEQVKCVFKGSQTEQKCYAAVDNNGLTCSGKESCVIDVSRAKGEKITWKSSCGGYAYTTMDGTGEYDGRGEYAEFNCAVATTTTTTPTPQPIESKVEVIDMKYKAKDMFDNKYDSILSELKQLRDTIKEQQNEIKYLKSMAKELKNISENMKSAINDFITYGVDANTVKLGAGERAAVINSYKASFAKLPETEAELTDAIKIANGRFPSLVSDAAEKTAKDQFIKIYKRIADLNDAKDNAAIKVMAYGLRQKAANRNLNSEKSGIKIFKAIYGNTPKTTQDWNAMQAITYSGAAREKDSDGDLLSDEMEAQYGTDPNKADSDGDGFKDGVEVNGGYNPKGAGKLK